MAEAEDEDVVSPLFNDKGCAADTACCEGSFTKLVLEMAPVLLGSAAEQRREEEIGNGVNTAEDIAMAASVSDSRLACGIAAI